MGFLVFAWCQWVGSNHRPRGYESRALNQLSYIGKESLIARWL